MKERRAGLATWLVVAAGLALWVRWSPLAANDLVAGDEGYYGTMARNILADPHQLASPSLWPLGPPGDKPPLYPALLAGSVRLLGPTEPALRWPTVLAAGMVALALAALVARALGGWWGMATAALLMTLPRLADAARSAATEIPLTALGCLAMVALARERVTRARAAAAGALLGAAFLCKLWFALAFALPALAMLWPWRGERLRAAAMLAATAALVGGLQLAAVALFRAPDLPHWWDVYWGFSFARRLGGGGYAGSWIQPPAFYWASLLHAFVALLPLVALGLEEAVRRAREPVPRALLVWALCIVPLSLFRVKSAVYANLLVPGWGALAVFGAHALASGRRPWGPGVGLFALASFPPLARAIAGESLPLPLWLAVWSGWLAVAAIVSARPPAARRVAIALLIGAAGIGLYRTAQRLPLRYHDVGYRAIAAAIAPILRDADPSRPSFIAPEAPAFGYYLFKAGRYWGTPYAPWSAAQRAAVAADASLRVFIVDAKRELYGGWPDSTMLGWLERSTREVTPEIERAAGRPLAVRVFVRPGPG
ncbi:MAG: glycosyltransferase family 39 protein [Candidatus Eisenbacteria bacterium]|nr:glycosyltransferase family 39 protein [Candidatus Eisenbacteria bacterium]